VAPKQPQKVKTLFSKTNKREYVPSTKKDRKQTQQDIKNSLKKPTKPPVSVTKVPEKGTDLYKYSCSIVAIPSSDSDMSSIAPPVSSNLKRLKKVSSVTPIIPKQRKLRKSKPLLSSNSDSESANEPIAKKCKKAKKMHVQSEIIVPSHSKANFVPTSNTPTSDLSPNTLVSNTLVSNSPVSNTPVSNTHVSNTPISNTPVSNTPNSSVDTPSEKQHSQYQLLGESGATTMDMIKQEEEEMFSSSSRDFEDYTSDEEVPDPPVSSSEGETEQFSIVLQTLKDPEFVSSTHSQSPILPSPEPILYLSPILTPVALPILSQAPNTNPILCRDPIITAGYQFSDSCKASQRLGPSMTRVQHGIGETRLMGPTFGLIQRIRHLKYQTSRFRQSVFLVERGQAANLHKHGWVYVTNSMIGAEQSSIEGMLFNLLPEVVKQQVTHESTCLVRFVSGGEYVPPHVDKEVYGPSVGLATLQFSNKCLEKPALEFCDNVAEKEWEPCIKVPHQNHSVTWIWGHPRHVLHQVPSMPAGTERISVTYRIWMHKTCKDQVWED